MSYKCSICGANEVEHPGDICELCAIGQDPYSVCEPRRNSRRILLNGGDEIKNADTYRKDNNPGQDGRSVQIYDAGDLPSADQDMEIPPSQSDHQIDDAAKGNQPIASGISKNITVDIQRKSFLQKWFRSLFYGISFTLDNDITMFQVFPDFSGTSLNAMGNACDQVIVYGRLNSGSVAENNDVEIYGWRDADNNVIAKKIRNRASGTTVVPDRVISAGVIRMVTLLLLAAIAYLATSLGMKGMIFITVIVILFFVLFIRKK